MRKFYFVLFVLILLLIFSWRILDAVSSITIYAKFRDLRPLPMFVDVLYKGIKIGRVVSSHHSEDFEYTILKLRLHSKMVKLPENIMAKLMIEKRRFRDYDYIELVKSSEPSNKPLSSGATIDGETYLDSRNYFANQKKEDLEGIKDNLYQASESLLTTIDGIGALFSILQDVVSSNSANINKITKEVATSADNLGQLSRKINLGISQNSIENSVNSLEASLQNVDFSTQSLRQSLPNFLEDATSSANNLNKITSTISGRLNSPLGGIRLLFGGGKKCGIN